MVLVNTQINAHSLMGATNYNKKLICIKIIRLSSANAFTKISIALMEQDASSCMVKWMPPKGQRRHQSWIPRMLKLLNPCFKQSRKKRRLYSKMFLSLTKSFLMMWRWMINHCLTKNSTDDDYTVSRQSPLTVLAPRLKCPYHELVHWYMNQNNLFKPLLQT